MRSALQRVEWKQTMGYAYAYPVDLPEGGVNCINSVNVNFMILAPFDLFYICRLYICRL